MKIRAGSTIEIEGITALITQTINTDSLIFTKSKESQRPKDYLFFIVDHGMATIIKPT